MHCQIPPARGAAMLTISEEQLFLIRQGIDRLDNEVAAVIAESLNE